MRRHRLPSALSLIILPLLACGGDESVGVNDDDVESGGIDLTSSTSSATTMEPTTNATEMMGSGSAADESGGDGSCFDGIKNTNETDVDCGGPDCDRCEPGQDCLEDSDCTTDVCENGECQPPTCYDGVQNGNENGVDCGGGCPNACGQDDPCEEDFECEEGEFCNDEGLCEESSCENGIQDTFETDIDCGGVDCPDCDDGGTCLQDEDCVSGVCDVENMVCLEATCLDGVTNGDETDMDCGGPDCPDCPNGADCDDNTDCVSGVCDMGTCVADSCTDMIENGDETDVDCGGPVCPPCEDDAECDEDDDCESGVCNAGGTCDPPACDDMVQNGDETDVDCGNSCGMQTCETGERCDDDTDCVELVCEFTVCSVPDCFDGVENGSETGEDCGGPDCGPCDAGEGCSDDADCVDGVCNMMTGVCDPPACDDGVLNGDETDVDCGNSCGMQTCEVGEFCDDDTDCVELVCTLGLCRAPECDDGVQNGDEGGIDCQGSCPQPCVFGGEEDVNTTTNGFQTQPKIAVAPDSSFFVVVWTDSGQDGDGAGVYGQMYDNLASPMGGEFQINSTTADAQQFPDVTAHNGGFIVAWESGGDQDTSGTGIYFQRYDSTGATQGGETLANALTTADQRRPSVAADGTGAFVVCWDSDELTFEVYCGRFTAAGAAIAGDEQINTTTTGDEQLPVVARESGGAYTVAWQSSSAVDGDGIAVLMRRFNSVGTEVTAETIVNSTTLGDQGEPSIAMAGDGEFVIAYTSANIDSEGTGIGAQLFDGLGATVGGEFRVNTTQVGSQIRPSAAMNSGDAFWIAWQTDDDGSGTGIFGQRYDNTGTEIGVEFTVNPTTTSRQEDPAAAIRSTDEVIGVWLEGDAAFTTANIRMARYDGEL